jgi:hypothetical protein
MFLHVNGDGENLLWAFWVLEAAIRFKKPSNEEPKDMHGR